METLVDITLGTVEARWPTVSMQVSSYLSSSLLEVLCLYDRFGFVELRVFLAPLLPLLFSVCEKECFPL